MAEYVDKRCVHCKEVLPEGVNSILSCSFCGDASDRHRRYLEWKRQKEKVRSMTEFHDLFG